MPLRTKISLLSVHCIECDETGQFMIANTKNLACDVCGRVPKRVTFRDITPFENDREESEAKDA